jgi:hypothetical protein
LTARCDAITNEAVLSTFAKSGKDRFLRGAVEPVPKEGQPRMTHRGFRPQPKLSHGSNTDETRIKNEKIEQEQTEKTEENAESLFPLLSPVGSSVLRKKRTERNDWATDAHRLTQIKKRRRNHDG